MQPLNTTSTFFSLYIPSFHIPFLLLFPSSFAVFVFLRERICLTEIHLSTCQFISTTILAYILIKDYFKMSKWHQFD